VHSEPIIETGSQKMPKCSWCGADLIDHEPCQQRFERCMAMEFENPATFGSVHHLTVTCYMLQHNAYTRHAWLEARKMIAQFIQEGIAPAELRMRNQTRLDGKQRNWSVTRGAKLVEFNEIAWTRTIADICLDNPDIYCVGVKLWAASVFADTEALIQKLGV